MRLLLFLIFSISLFGEYLLKSDYTFSNPIITAKTLFPNIQKDIFIYKAPENRFSFYLNSNQIVEALRKYGFKISNNGIRRVKFTYVPQNLSLAPIREEILDNFFTTYPNIDIHHIDIIPKHPLKKLPESWSLIFRESNLRRSSGYFYIEDERGNKIHFKYIVDGSIYLLKSDRNIRKGEIIDNSNTYPDITKFDRYRGSYLSEEQLGKVVAKHYIPKDRAITSRMVEKLKVIQRNQIVRGFIQDGAVYIETDIRTLQGGGVGDIITIETSEGAILKAKIVSSKLVQIL